MMANEDVDESTQDSGKGLNGDVKKEKKKVCMQCGTLKKKLKFKVFYKGEQVQLCNEECFKAFKEKQPRKKDKCEACHEQIEQGGYLCSHLGTQQPLCSSKCFELTERKHSPKRVCLVCVKSLSATDPDLLLWETLEFCGVPCLRRYQLQIGAQCANCNVVVQETSLGKYCVRFGADIRQFCSGKCLEEFKKGLKVCAYCQRDLTRERIEPIVAQVGDKGTFKDFCSRECVKNYESLSPMRPTDPAEKCRVCNSRCAPPRQQLQLKYGNDNRLVACVCSEPCVARFRYDNKLEDGYCENCQCFRTRSGQSIMLQLGVRGPRKKFCSKTCLNLFVLGHRRIVPCCWCKVKKYNFDMIERLACSATGTVGDVVQLFCSIYCLNLHKAKTSQATRQHVSLQQRHATVALTAGGVVQVPAAAQLVQTSLNRAQQQQHGLLLQQQQQQHQQVQQLLQQQHHQVAAAAAAAAAAQQQKQQQHSKTQKDGTVKCDQCQKLARPQFHLTMSDASVRNFCCYPCALSFQNLFKNKQQQQQQQQAAQAAQQKAQQAHQSLLRGNKVVLTAQTVNLPQVGATNQASGSAVGQVLPAQMATNHLVSANKRISTTSVANPQIHATHHQIPTASHSQLVTKVAQPAALTRVYTATGSQLQALAQQQQAVAVAAAAAAAAQQAQMTGTHQAVTVAQSGQLLTPGVVASAPGVVAAPVVSAAGVPTTGRLVNATAIPAQQLGVSSSAAGIIHQLNNSKIIIRPPPPKEMRNKSVQCKPADDTDIARVEEVLYANGKPTRNGALLNIERMRLSFSGDKAIEFEKELEQMARKLADRLKEQKVNGGLCHETLNETERKRRSEFDQENGNVVDSDQGVKRFKSNVEELIHDATEQWSEWARRHKFDGNSDCEPKNVSNAEFSKLTPEEMNKALCAFGKDIQEDANSEDVLRLERIFLGLQLYLDKLKIKANIFNDGVFCAFNDYFITLSSSLEPEKVESTKLIPEDLFWQTDQLGDTSPELLLTTVAFVIAKYAHIVELNVHEDLKFNEVIAESLEHDGVSTKIIKIGDKVIKPNTLCKERCPVVIIEKYISKCPRIVRTGNGRFYLEPKTGLAASTLGKAKENLSADGDQTNTLLSSSGESAQQAETSESSGCQDWYSEEPMDRDGLARALSRFKVVCMVDL